ncbi:hypothetical protein Poly24_11720 [Rosistilla carotiformis]|uniref:Uncharacterized protein n=1 Tax=Rosistilla carotiformis TaxID=2528017 RepID=A0A518JPK0_9BACT|nr:hypothetical protein Poly24_11720 [Rosistilla carotiformis]
MSLHTFTSNEMTVKRNFGLILCGLREVMALPLAK